MPNKYEGGTNRSWVVLMLEEKILIFSWVTIHPVGKGSRSVEFDYFEEYIALTKEYVESIGRETFWAARCVQNLGTDGSQVAITKKLFEALNSLTGKLNAIDE